MGREIYLGENNVAYIQIEIILRAFQIVASIEKKEAREARAINVNMKQCNAVA